MDFVFSIEEKLKMVEHIINKEKRKKSWVGAFDLAKVFDFNDVIWSKRPTLAAIHFSGDLIELARLGVECGDGKCIEEINNLLLNAPNQLKAHIYNGITEAKHSILGNNKVSKSYKAAVTLINI